MDKVRRFAWKFRGELRPEEGSVRPVGPVSVVELQGTTVAGVVRVGLLVLQ
jgi:hypothetical protein